MTPDKPNRDALIDAYAKRCFLSGEVVARNRGMVDLDLREVTAKEAQAKSALVAYIEGLERRIIECTTTEIEQLEAENAKIRQTHALLNGVIKLTDQENAELRAAIVKRGHDNDDDIGVCGWTGNYFGTHFPHSVNCTPDTCIWARVNQAEKIVP